MVCIKLPALQFPHLSQYVELETAIRIKKVNANYHKLITN